KDRLVALPVGRLVGPFNIRRERDVAMLPHEARNVGLGGEFEDPCPVLEGRLDGGPDPPLREGHNRPRVEPPRRAGECLPRPLPPPGPQQEDLDLPVETLAAGVEAGMPDL